MTDAAPQSHEFALSVTELLSRIEARLPRDAESRTLVSDLRREFVARRHSTHESETRYRHLLDTIDEGFCIVEMIFDEEGSAVDYRFLETNAAFEKHTGLLNAEGRRMSELAPGNEAHWFERYGVVALTGQPAHFFQHAAQLGRWFEVHAAPIGAPENRQVAILLTDITERKQHEELIAQRESDLRRAQAMAHLGSWRWDMTRNVVTWSEEMYRIYGLDPASGPPSPHSLDLVHPDDRSLHLEKIRTALAGEEVAPFEIRIVRPSGEVRVVQSSRFEIDRDSHNRGVVLYGTVLDITEQKRAEAALRESEERFHAMADNIPNLAWMATADGDIQWFNQRWLDYTGANVEQVRASDWKIVHHPDHREGVFSFWMRALTAGIPWEDTFPLRGKDGTYRWFLSRAVPIRDESGRIVRWFGTNTDVTQLRETETALQRANEQLQAHARQLETVVSARTAELKEKIEALEAFSYSLSHDMRAPLRVMKGFSDILKADYGPRLDLTGNRCLERIGSAADRLEQLIEDVLAYSRVVREQMDLRPVNVEQLIRQLIDENPALQPPHAEIEIRSPLASVLGHAAALTQAIGNLIYNGVKFVAAGQRPHLIIWTESVNNVVRLFIRDNGIGIPPQVQSRLFGLFQRFHAGQSYEGTGIGLAIVRKAVERMGGTTGVESEPGRGSTFWIQLNSVPP